MKNKSEDFVGQLQNKVCRLLRKEIKALPSRYLRREIDPNEKLIEIERSDEKYIYHRLAYYLMDKYSVPFDTVADCKTMRQLINKSYAVASDLAKEKVENDIGNFVPLTYRALIIERSSKEEVTNPLSGI